MRRLVVFFNGIQLGRRAAFDLSSIRVLRHLPVDRIRKDHEGQDVLPSQCLKRITGAPR